MESKTIRRFRREIIEDLPSFPNNRETKSTLDSKTLTELLIDYLAWKTRLVTPRKRTIIINPEVNLNDTQTSNILNSHEYLILKESIENGEDVTPYLSLKALQEGYSPTSSENGNSWVAKDFTLNVMNLYHFHLLPYEKNKQHSTRTDDLIFAKVDKTTFEIIGVFDHSVFKKDADTHELNSERTRLYRTWDNIIESSIPDGGVYNQTSLTMSGHTREVVHSAQRYSSTIQEYDLKLGDLDFLKLLYIDSDIPNNPNLQWHINGTDLGLLDKMNNYYIFHHGKN